MIKTSPLLFIIAIVLIVGCKKEPAGDKDKSKAKPQAKKPDTPKEKDPPKQPDKPPIKPAADPETEKVAAEVRKIVANVVDVKPESLDATVPLMGDKIGVDKYELIDIQEALRNKYKITVTDEDLSDLKTLTLDKLTVVVRRLQRRMFGN